MMNISQILEQLIQDHDLNTLELSRRTGIAQPVIYRLVSGETLNPKIETVCKLADYFKITVNQLIGELSLPELDTYTKTYQSFKIPLLEWNQIISWKNNRKLTGQIPKIATELAPNPNLYAVTMYDDSMEPVFPKNTVLIIDANKKPKDSNYIIVKLRNQKQPIFRQLHIDDELRYLQSLNPNTEKYKMKLFSDDDKYCGLLIQAKKNYGS